jgi:hypothetical protein
MYIVKILYDYIKTRINKFMINYQIFKIFFDWLKIYNKLTLIKKFFLLFFF